MFDSSYSFEPLLNSEQAAALVRVHPKTLQRLARSGLVIGYRIGKQWRFRASDLDEWTKNVDPKELDVAAPQRYSVFNHSCPQPNRR